VPQLEGVEKEIAIVGYVAALQGLFVAGSVLSVVMIGVQAATGWTAPVVEKPGHETVVGEQDDEEEDE
jgi:hypothetical protein